MILTIGNHIMTLTAGINAAGPVIITVLRPMLPGDLLKTLIFIDKSNQRSII